MSKLITVKSLKNIIDFYALNNPLFKEYFSFNLNTEFETTPYDLFKAYFKNQALFTNDKNVVYAKFNLIYDENKWIFNQIANKIKNINDLLNKDNYADITQDNTIGQNKTINTQNDNTTTIQKTIDKNNNLTTDDNSYSEKENVEVFSLLNANVKSQAFSINDFNNATTTSLSNNNTLTINNEVIRVNKNTAQAILNIMNVEALNFREEFLKSFIPMFINITVKEDIEEELTFNDVYVSNQVFNDYKQFISDTLLINQEQVNLNRNNINQQMILFNEYKTLNNTQINELKRLFNALNIVYNELKKTVDEKTNSLNILINTNKELINRNKLLNDELNTEQQIEIKENKTQIENNNTLILSLQQELTTLQNSEQNILKQLDLFNKESLKLTAEDTFIKQRLTELETLTNSLNTKYASLPDFLSLKSKVETIKNFELETKTIEKTSTQQNAYINLWFGFSQADSTLWNLKFKVECPEFNYTFTVLPSFNTDEYTHIIYGKSFSIKAKNDNWNDVYIRPNFTFTGTLKVTAIWTRLKG